MGKPIVKFERTGFNVEDVLSYSKEDFVKTHRVKMYIHHKPAARDEMLRRVYNLCKEENARIIAEAKAAEEKSKGATS